MGQTDKIRELFKQFKGDEKLVVQAYAAAERSGEVERKSNAYGHSAEEYAHRLFYDTFKRKR